MRSWPLSCRDATWILADAGSGCPSPAGQEGQGETLSDLLAFVRKNREAVVLSAPGSLLGAVVLRVLFSWAVAGALFVAAILYLLYKWRISDR